MVKPTRALSDRPGCNIHPAGVRKVRHSKEQVEADHKASLKADQKKIRDIQMAQDFLARMNMLKECKENDLPTMYLQRLSTRINKQPHVDAETESDECFNIRADECSDPDASPSPDRATEAKLRVSAPAIFDCVGTHDFTACQHQKRIKGAAHQELLSKTKALRVAECNKSQAGKSKCGVWQ